MEEWKEYKLGDISTMKYGKLPPSSESGKYPVWSGYRYVGMANTFNCAKGTLVVVARGVGGTGDVKVAKENCYLTNLSISVDIDTQICNPYFLHYKYLIKNLRYLDSGSAQSQITIDSLKNLPIEIPSLVYQNHVVAILKSLDDKIEVNRRINDNLEQQAQALFKSWFVDFEPFKNGEFVESELGMIPKGWRVLSFKDFIKPISDKASVGSLPEYSVTNNGIKPRDAKFKKKLSSENSKNKILRKDNLIFGMSREILNWGIMEDEIGGVSSAYNIYEIDKDTLSPVYLKFYMSLKISDFNSLIGTAAREGQSLDKGALMQKTMYIPSKDVFEAFCRIYSPINILQKEIENESRRLATLRDTLLPKLMSGELRVPDTDLINEI